MIYDLKELLLAVQNKNIELINKLYEDLDEGLLVLFLEYVKNVVEENIGEKLNYLRELSFCRDYLKAPSLMGLFYVRLMQPCMH